MEIEDGGCIVKEWELPCNVLLSKIHRWLHDFEARGSLQMLTFMNFRVKPPLNPNFRLRMPTSTKMWLCLSNRVPPKPTIDHY